MTTKDSLLQFTHNLSITQAKKIQFFGGNSDVEQQNSELCQGAFPIWQKIMVSF